MERRESWDRVLAILQSKYKRGDLSSKERTLMKVLSTSNSPRYISEFLEDCSDFKILIRELDR